MKLALITALVLSTTVTTANAGSAAYIDQIGPHLSTYEMSQSVTLNNIVLPAASMAASIQNVRDNFGRASGSISLISQTGSNHLLQVNQTGNGNIGLITQAGYGNAAVLMQTGSNNIGLISQLGYGNSVNLTQTGANHSAVVTQQGHGNVAIIHQR